VNVPLVEFEVAVEIDFFLSFISGYVSKFYIWWERYPKLNG